MGVFERCFFEKHLFCYLYILGCGKGLVPAFLVKEHGPCRLCGVEINEISWKCAADWTQKYGQVSVTFGDVFRMDCNPYTVLFMGRPFLPVTFLQFIEKLEKELTHPVTLIY